MLFKDLTALGQPCQVLWLSIWTSRLVDNNIFTSLEALYGFFSHDGLLLAQKKSCGKKW